MPDTLNYINILLSVKVLRIRKQLKHFYKITQAQIQNNFDENNMSYDRQSPFTLNKIYAQGNNRNL